MIKGHGFFHHPDGTTYDGNWIDNKKRSFGTVKYSQNNYENALSYEGFFQNYAKSGIGLLKWKDGSQYIGNFQNGSRSGNVSINYSDGKNYCGNWKDDKKNGFGKLGFAENDSSNQFSYEGNFENDKKSGNGTLK
jgi:hypothetical protein